MVSPAVAKGAAGRNTPRVIEPAPDIHGEAAHAVEALISEAGWLDGPSRVPLTRRVQDYVHERHNRSRYVSAATDYLRGKQPGADSDYDVILIGAGLHAAMFLYTAKQQNPAIKALIVEKSPDVCSTFARLGDSLVLNSPTFTKVGLNANLAQGHFIQVSDFDELAERQYPTAKHLHELATMILFHADADIVFNFSVDGVQRAGYGYAVSSKGRTLTAQAVVLTNGMGEQRDNAFRVDQRSNQIIDGDEFIAACYGESEFRDLIRGKRIAVIGAGDTANCVMEHLLPLTYPNHRYPSFQKGPFLPSRVYWIGQGAENIQDFYFANKQRYGHSGGIIEFFWDGEAPFDLPADDWEQARALIERIPARLDSVTHGTMSLELVADGERFEADLVVNCTGRSNDLSAKLRAEEYEFVLGDIVFQGGKWDDWEDRFVLSPRPVERQRIACKLVNERIFLLGCACPLDELIDNNEALDGSLRYQEEKTSLTNAKYSLEHTLPRTVAFAEQFINNIGQ